MIAVGPPDISVRGRWKEELAALKGRKHSLEKGLIADYQKETAYPAGYG